MTNDDKEALKEILSGFLNVCGVIAVFLVLAYFLIAGTTKTQTPSGERFKVVDRYDDRCDIIRYLPEMSGKYVYFLDCPTQRHLVLKK